MGVYETNTRGRVLQSDALFLAYEMIRALNVFSVWYAVFDHLLYLLSQCFMYCY
jgi:hypothetical protein